MEISECQEDRAPTEEVAEPQGTSVRFAEAGPGR